MGVNLRLNTKTIIKINQRQKGELDSMISCFFGDISPEKFERRLDNVKKSAELSIINDGDPSWVILTFYKGFSHPL